MSKQFDNVSVVAKANVYFDGKQPWTTRKTDLERTATTLYVCCQVVHALVYAMTPFLPQGAARLADIIGVQLPKGGPEGGPDSWSEGKRLIPAGSPLNTPQVLFPKLDKDRIAELAEIHRGGGAM